MEKFSDLISPKDLVSHQKEIGKNQKNLTRLESLSWTIGRKRAPNLQRAPFLMIRGNSITIDFNT
jgi:hypothetical protein